MKDKIAIVFKQVFSDFSEAGEPPQLTAETILLETGLSSLGFAILVTQLEEELGYDPFSLCAEPFYPKTFGELVDFYQKNQPA